jgi:putative ATPase
LGRGQGYLYPHDDPAGFAFDCLPEELRGRVYFEPSGHGEEQPVARSADAEEGE